jgi:hypothetical protein
MLPSSATDHIFKICFNLYFCPLGFSQFLSEVKDGLLLLPLLLLLLVDLPELLELPLWDVRVQRISSSRRGVYLHGILVLG